MQVHLLETMKTAKETTSMTTNRLMFPQVYGLTSDEALPVCAKLSCMKPKETKPYIQKYIGLEKNLVYRVFEAATLPKTAKNALFVHLDQTKSSFDFVDYDKFDLVAKKFDQ
jgi:hypothetical protein